MKIDENCTKKVQIKDRWEGMIKKQELRAIQLVKNREKWANKAKSAKNCMETQRLARSVHKNGHNSLNIWILWIIRDAHGFGFEPVSVRLNLEPEQPYGYGSGSIVFFFFLVKLQNCC